MKECCLKHRTLVATFFFVVSWSGTLSAQTPTMFRPPSLPALQQPQQPVQPPQQPTTPATEPATPATEPATQGGGVQAVASGVAHYDPNLDNRLFAPKIPEGLFGMKIRDVEGVLRNYGAKPHSYAFGKHSKMTFSVYILTLYFDRERRLGRLEVAPRPPFSSIEPNARHFLMTLFLQGADVQQFRTIISPGKLEITYDPPLPR